MTFGALLYFKGSRYVTFGAPFYFKESRNVTFGALNSVSNTNSSKYSSQFTNDY